MSTSIATGLEDAARVFLAAEWRDLVMLNYAVDPALVEPLVPPGTELDFFEGRAYISLVGFRFLHTAVLGFRIPFHQDFEEVNLRFYVRSKHHSPSRRGVVFIREIVPLRAVAAVARLVFNENYVRLPMSHRITGGTHEHRGPRETEYSWRSAGSWNRVRVVTEGESFYPADQSAEQFISEHYWGYCRQNETESLEYEVQHPPWRVWTAREARFEGDATALYGAAFAEVLRRQPQSALLAEGSPVTVFKGTKII